MLLPNRCARRAHRAGGVSLQTVGLITLVGLAASATIGLVGSASSESIAGASQPRPHDVSVELTGHSQAWTGPLSRARQLMTGAALAPLKAQQAGLEAMAAIASGVTRRVDGTPVPAWYNLPRYVAGRYQDEVANLSLGQFLVGVDRATLSSYADEAVDAARLMDERGVLQDPTSFHVRHAAPTAADGLKITPGRKFRNGLREYQMSWRSAYEPQDWLPGSARFRALEQTDTVHAKLLRHDDGVPRPWIVMMHGFGMGQSSDLLASGAQKLARDLDVNVAAVTYPFHGKRGRGIMDMQNAIGPDMMMTLNAQSQGLSDVRQMIRWIEQEEPGQPVGVYGISMGGLGTGNLAALEPDLAQVTAVVPAYSLESVLHLLEPEIGQRAARAGAKVFAPITPNKLGVTLDSERLHVIGGKADLVTGGHAAQQMADHWGSTITWLPDGHLGAILPSVPVLTKRFKAAGVIGPQ